MKALTEYLKQHHREVIQILLGAATFILAAIALYPTPPAAKKLMIHRLGSVSMDTFWPEGTGYILSDEKNIRLEDTTLHQYLLVNQSIISIKPDEYIEPLSIADHKNEIIAITPCNENIITQCGVRENDSISIPTTNWDKISDTWKMVPTALLPNEKICLAIIAKNSLQLKILEDNFSGRLSDTKISFYHKLKETSPIKKLGQYLIQFEFRMSAYNIIFLFIPVFSLLFRLLLKFTGPEKYTYVLFGGLISLGSAEALTYLITNPINHMHLWGWIWLFIYPIWLVFVINRGNSSND